MSTNPIEDAVRHAGSQTKLARMVGCSQNAIWRAMKRNRVSVQMAILIERATDGAVPAARLRPDFFGADTSRATP